MIEMRVHFSLSFMERGIGVKRNSGAHSSASLPKVKHVSWSDVLASSCACVTAGVHVHSSVWEFVETD